jgi:DNA modification methylase
VSVRVLHGDCRDVLRTLPDQSVQCVVTSPPYFGLRDYGVAGQIGLEPSPAEFVAEMVAVFGEVWRVLRDDGVCWLNLGDSYAANRPYQVSQSKHQTHDYGNSNASRVPDGLKPKDLIGIPWRVAFALQEAGWYLRRDVIWAKPNPMPESVTDRPTSSHEYLFLLTKRARYFYDAEAVREPHTAEPRAPGGYNPAKAVGPMERGGHSQWESKRTIEDSYHPGGRNLRSVWTIATAPFSEAHFATFPPKLAETCILAGSRKGDTVLDPFGGAGTTGLVADRLQRDAVLIELNPDYVEIINRRVTKDAGLFAEVTHA